MAYRPDPSKKKKKKPVIKAKPGAGKAMLPNLSAIRAGFSRNPSVPRSPSSSDGPGAKPPARIPTFAELLAADQIYQQLLRNSAAESVQDKEGMLSAWKRAMINFGEIPSDMSFMPGGLGEALDPGVRDLIAKNTKEGLSVLARLNKAYSDRQMNITNNLAARGIIGSGETGYQYGENALANKQGQYDARQRLLDVLLGAENSWIQAERARQAALLAAAQGVIDRNQEPPDDSGGGDPGGGNNPPSRPQPDPFGGPTHPYLPPILKLPLPGPPRNPVRPPNFKFF